MFPKQLKSESQNKGGHPLFVYHSRRKLQFRFVAIPIVIMCNATIYIIALPIHCCITTIKFYKLYLYKVGLLYWMKSD
jgi:hypothetical protein